MRVRAPDLPSLFSESLRALMYIMFPPREVSGGSWPAVPRGAEVERLRVSLNGSETEELMQAFLSEVLYLTDVHSVVFCGADILLREDGLDASLSAAPFDPSLHAGGAEVKGISFSGMQIAWDGSSYVMEMLFDV